MDQLLKKHKPSKLSQAETSNLNTPTFTKKKKMNSWLKTSQKKKISYWINTDFTQPLPKNRRGRNPIQVILWSQYYPDNKKQAKPVKKSKIKEQYLWWTYMQKSSILVNWIYKCGRKKQNRIIHQCQVEFIPGMQG